MKKIFMLAFLLLAGQTILAQNSKLIIGKWAYVSLQDSPDMDDQSKQMMDMLFKNLSINFRTDNTMTLAMRNKPEHGTYAFDKNDQAKVTATSATGKEMNLTVVKLNEKELVLTLDQAGTLVLNKVSDTPDAVEIVPVTPKVPATMKQISGKWYAVGKEGQKSAMASELIKGSYVEFGANGKYRSEVLTIHQAGTWTMGEGNTTVNVDLDEDGKAVWSIYKISDTELVMQNDTSNSRMIFSRAKP